MKNQENTNKETQNLMEQFRYYNSLQHRYFSQKRHGKAESGDLHRGQGRVLALLTKVGEISQKELAFLLGMRRQSVGELLVKLEDKGLITRTQSEDDKRVMLVAITDSGSEVVAEMQTKIERQSLFAVLDAAEQAALETIMDKLIVALEEQTGTTREEALAARREMKMAHGSRGHGRAGRHGHHGPRHGERNRDAGKIGYHRQRYTEEERARMKQVCPPIPAPEMAEVDETQED